VGTTFFRFVTNHSFDRRTDNFLVARSRYAARQKINGRTDGQIF